MPKPRDSANIIPQRYLYNAVFVLNLGVAQGPQPSGGRTQEGEGGRTLINASIADGTDLS